MAFRQRANSSDQWKRFLLDNERRLSLIGLPGPVLLNQHAFERFLTTGSSDETVLRIDDFSDDAFATLEEVVNLWEPDWGQLNYTAFAKERLKRFGRYA